MGTKFVGNFFKTQSIQPKVFVCNKLSMAATNVFQFVAFGIGTFHWNAKDNSMYFPRMSILVFLLFQRTCLFLNKMVSRYNLLNH